MKDLLEKLTEDLFKPFDKEEWLSSLDNEGKEAAIKLLQQYGAKN